MREDSPSLINILCISNHFYLQPRDPNAFVVDQATKKCLKNKNKIIISYCKSSQHAADNWHTPALLLNVLTLITFGFIIAVTLYSFRTVNCDEPVRKSLHPPNYWPCMCHTHCIWNNENKNGWRKKRGNQLIFRDCGLHKVIFNTACLDECE